MKQKIDILCAVREDHAIRQIMGQMEAEEDCAFRVVSSGADALRAAQRFAPDILVVDAVLPMLDGLALVDRLTEQMGGRMPRVIGGSMMPFSDAAFERRGVTRIVRVPWMAHQLRRALMETMEEIRTQIDWTRATDAYAHACALLGQLGMRSTLRGYEYLAWAATLVGKNESRLYTLGERVYAPIAEKYGATQQNVERLIRHAVESAVDAARADALYGFFGNTIDPTRGKPTNAQMIGMLAQKIRARETAYCDGEWKEHA